MRLLLALSLTGLMTIGTFACTNVGAATSANVLEAKAGHEEGAGTILDCLLSGGVGEELKSTRLQIVPPDDRQRARVGEFVLLITPAAVRCERRNWHYFRQCAAIPRWEEGEAPSTLRFDGIYDRFATEHPGVDYVSLGLIAAHPFGHVSFLSDNGQESPYMFCPGFDRAMSELRSDRFDYREMGEEGCNAAVSEFRDHRQSCWEGAEQAFSSERDVVHFVARHALCPPASLNGDWNTPADDFQSRRASAE